MRASASASRHTVASRSANGTDRFTSPQAAASRPESGRPVSATSFAFVSPSR
jgi:hypothetical protein